MGLPRFYLYPSTTTSTLTIVAPGEVMSDVQETPLRDVADERAISGRLVRTVLGGRRRVQIILENFTSQSVERTLTNMQSHLERGGYVGFSHDHDKTFGAFATTAPASADTTIRHGGNFWSAWSSAGALAANDELLIQSPNPEYTWEVRALTSQSSTRVVLAESLFYDYTEEPVLLRWRDFYPMLQLPQDELGKAIVVHSHRVTYTLDVTLEEDPAALHALYDLGESALGGTTKSDKATSLAEALTAKGVRARGASGGFTTGTLFGSGPRSGKGT